MHALPTIVCVHVCVYKLDPSYKGNCLLYHIEPLPLCTYVRMSVHTIFKLMHTPAVTRGEETPHKSVMMFTAERLQCRVWYVHTHARTHVKCQLTLANIYNEHTYIYRTASWVPVIRIRISSIEKFHPSSIYTPICTYNLYTLYIYIYSV